jgi:phosphoribosylglycinamide formyltransferase-1
LSESLFKIAVLVSGGGTTLRNLIGERDAGRLRVDFGLVISSNPGAGGIAIARAASIPVRIIDHRRFPTADAISEQIFAACRELSVQLVVMGGFLRKITVPADFENRVVNIHPSLIPEFCGKGMYGSRVHEAVIGSGATLSGCTVHFVDNQYDHGPVIARQSVPVEQDDDPRRLAARVHKAECELYPRVIAAIAAGEVVIPGGNRADAADGQQTGQGHSG